jgi:hypothetical protein
MPLFSRCDGDLVTGENAERMILPFIMRGRNESLVYLEQQIDVTRLLAYLDRVNAGLPEKKLSFFHVVLCAAARAMGARPKMNRFVIGRRIYQRKKMEFSFAIKKEMVDDAAMTIRKLEFFPNDTLDAVVQRMDDAITHGRGTKETTSEKEMSFFVKLPVFALRLVTWLFRALDYFNLAPRAMIEADELYCSVFFANLGSVGLEAPYHHLYEWGTAPLFGTIGRIFKAPVVNDKDEIEIRSLCSFKWSIDERITDGFYCARSLDLMKDFLADPTLLEKAPDEKVVPSNGSTAAESLAEARPQPPIFPAGGAPGARRR